MTDLDLTLLKSKRFWVLFFTLLAFVAKDQWGLELDVETWAYLAGAVIAGYSIEDWIEAWAGGKIAPDVFLEKPTATPVPNDVTNDIAKG